MVKEEILEGLRIALSKGETLQQAMISFYNAGYKREEIEEAARDLTIQIQKPVQQSPPQEKQISNKPIFPKKPPPPITYNSIASVSEYGPKKKVSKEKIIALVLVILLLILIGVLGLLFLFKEELVNFFNSLF
ncbi:MAG: hypothetical protein KKF68_01750 [Nanoarchaeota archaeon]|nr:hypothetical protein [Nanoarchaeota archaeon]